MASKKILPRGRLLYIDPNPPGQELINPEDLSILVELTTDRKSRSTISSGGEITSTFDSSGTVSFLEGSPVGSSGRRSLTTSYTEINTRFDKPSDDDLEGFGMTDIDIKFNTAYAPLVKIKFVDTRGTALTRGKNSKYNVFFELPYPIFRLKIKGYYGKAVMYCLHMRKWNAEFNSKTGNFEIEAEFIGYTYAMLADLLMGYLKAVPYTDAGKDIFAGLKAEYETQTSNGVASPVMTIDEMIQSISVLNESIEKFKQSDPTYKKLLGINKANNILGEIKQIIANFFSKAQISNATILVSDGETWMAVEDNADNKVDSTIKDYKEEVETKIDELKKVVKSTNITKSDFEVIVTGAMNRTNPREDFKNQGDYDLSGKKDARGKLIDDSQHVNNMSTRIKGAVPNDSINFKVYDLFKAAEEVNRIIDKNRDLETQAKSELTVKLRDVAEANGDFVPTIRNVFRILTVHCETLMRVVQATAIEAEKDGNDPRTDALLGLGRPNLSIPANSTIYAFPEFQENGEEVYLGKRVSPNEVNEIALVEDFLQALIKSKQADLTADSLRLNSEVDWFALTPMDTKASQAGGLAGNPYRVDLVKNQDELLRKLMYRMFLYLGTGNVDIDDELLTFMAKFEANNMYYGTRDLTIRDIIANNYNDGSSIINHFKSGSKNIPNKYGNNLPIPYMIQTGSTYQYRYISDGKRAFIPVNGGWDGQDFYKNQLLKPAADLKKLSTNTNNLLFVGNYINGDNNTTKVDDGSKYVKILDRAEYDKYQFSLPFEDNVDLKESYDKKFEPGTRAKQSDIEKGLKDDQPIKKLNPLDTKFGVTEFFEVEAGGGYPASDLTKIKNDKDNAKLMPAFYRDNTTGDVDERMGTRLRRKSEFVDIWAEDDREDKLRKLDVGHTIKLVDDGLISGGTEIVMDKIGFGFANKRGSGAEITEQSLFGSALYYAQEASVEETYAKGFLFLNTLPLNGMKTPMFLDNSTQGRTILGALASNAGFVSLPSSWVYWIGSLLWRDNYFTENNIDPIITRVDFNGNQTDYGLVPTVFTYPTTKELWYATGVNTFPALIGPTMLLCSDSNGTATYRAIEDTIMNLPEQVKQEFIDNFLAFVDNDFATIQEELEIPIFGGNITAVGANNDIAAMGDWFTEGQQRITSVCTGDNSLGDNSVPYAGRNYHRYTPKIFSDGSDLDCNEYSQGVAPVWYELDMVENTPVNRRLIDLVLNKSVLMNYTYNTFRNLDSTSIRGPIAVDQSKADTFIDLVAKEYADIHKKFNEEVKNEQNIKNQIFQSTNGENIKLNIYRYLASVNNKWLGSNNNPDEIFMTCQDFGPSKALAEERATMTRLIDMFFFINQAFTDIGDDFLLNPKTLSDMITGNLNQSFFDYISRVLTDNNFDFIPLPAYVNFKTIDGLSEIFEPFSYKQIVTNDPNTSVGPSFICTYVGQYSRHLDLGKDADFPNDGADLSDRIGVTLKNAQFTSPPDDKTGGLAIPTFAVNFAQQNQNYFKEVKLDQAEYTETDESLVTIDNISKSGDKNTSTYVGQNLFNTYQTRSYTAEVEAMGMPLIQPMMYFQLNNIPMFRGAYLIFDTSHKIKPNYMSTNFKGKRIKDVLPPLIESVFELTDLLGEIDGAESLQYSLDETIYDNNIKTSGSTSLPLDDLDPATADYYGYGYNRGYDFKNQDFNRSSNTKRNGSFLTYEQVFQEVSDITKVPVTVLKTMSVIESTVGKNKTGNPNSVNPNNDGMNSSGFVGLMQFGYPASKDVKPQVESAIFGRGLEFYAVVDEPNKKIILPPEVSTNSWSKFPNVNNKESNSMFDDYISTMASAYYAIDNLNVGDPSEISCDNIVDIYLSHQQGATGYRKIKENPTEKLCDPDDTSLDGVARNMRNNPPVKELDERTSSFSCSTVEGKKNTFSQWLAAWRGRVDRVTYQIDPDCSAARLADETAVWDGASETRIDTLHPAIRSKTREFINLAEKNGLKLRVTSAFRSYAEQTALYNQGRFGNAGSIVTNAQAGYSYHNFGLAFDVVPIVNRQAVWDNESYWTKAAQYGKATGFDWGGDWTSFQDKPHFQMVFGLTTAQLRAIKSGGDLLADGYVDLNSDLA